MYSANQLNVNGKVTLFPMLPTIKALGDYIQRHNVKRHNQGKHGDRPESIAVYKNRKFHAYYAMRDGKLYKKGTVRLSQYMVI